MINQLSGSAAALLRQNIVQTKIGRYWLMVHMNSFISVVFVILWDGNFVEFLSFAG